MLIDRSHKNWVIFTIAATFAASVAYLIYYRQSFEAGGNGPSGASWPGLAFGIAGYALMIFCGLLGARRTVRVWRLGSAQSWLRAHVWLGLLSFPLILFHAGMKFGNQLTLWLMLLFLVVIISGIVGLILQNILPRSMLARVQSETTYEQIPDVIDVLHREADELVAEVCGPMEGSRQDAGTPALLGSGVRAAVKKEGQVQGKIVKTKPKAAEPVSGSEPLKHFYLSEVKPFLSQTFHADHKLATARGAIAVFSHTRTLLPDSLHDTLKDLESVCEERRQLALQLRLHHWLHGWEFVHVPLSYALLAVSTVHAIVATVKY